MKTVQTYYNMASLKLLVSDGYFFYIRKYIQPKSQLAS